MISSESRTEIGLYLLAAVFALVGFGLPRLEDRGWEPRTRDPATLRVMTWNVGGTGGPAGSALDDRHVAHVAKVLSALDPDLVCLQELHGPDQLRLLVDRLRDSGRDWKARLGRHGERRVALLTQRGRLRVRAHLAGGDRDYLLGTWDSRSGRRIGVAGLHADAYAAETRNLEIGRAADGLRQIAGTSAKILLGDLNIDVDPDKRHELFSANEARDVDTYNYIADRLEDIARGTGSTAEPDRRLDYIFVSPGVFTVHGAGPVRGRRTGNMDHDPVVADLTWKRSD